MSLLIVESPAKCSKIQSYLGQGWKVIASMGHIRGLAHNLNFLKTDFEPTYEFLKEKAKAIGQLKDAAKSATQIYLAADKDMEGEQIAYSVCLLLKLNPRTAKRITFTEITEKAIKHAIEHPTTIDMNRVHTQQCRAMLDLLIGFTMSPLLWKYVAPSLSAGRCQTPAIRLVIEREDAIQSFKVASSWKLSADWITNNTTFSSIMEDELEDEESAINYMEQIHQTPQGTILSKEIKPWSESAPFPLITSTLQQQASALYGSNPKSTMQSAQRLYEAGHITYMRTDKAVLSEEASIEAKQWVLSTYGQEYVKEQKEQKDKKEKKEQKEQKTQEAHEAIRPTHMDMIDLDEKWSAYDKKIYHLIWQRTIQSVMSSAKGETCIVKSQIDNDTDFVWRSQWKRTLFEGWKKAGKIANIDEEAQEEEQGWPEVEPGQIIKWTQITAEPKETKAQGRYTEATLIRELEKHGIGRPSTFASLIEVIQEKNYVELATINAKEIDQKIYTIQPLMLPKEIKQKKKIGAEKNKLVPTELGRSVLTFMLRYFEDLFSYHFTNHMEKNLDKIADGSIIWKDVIKELWDSYKDRYEEMQQNQQNQQNQPNQTKIKHFQQYKAVQTKKGPLLLKEHNDKPTEFLGWPKGITFEDITEQQALEFIQKEQDNVGEWNGHPIIKKSGKFGPYFQCDKISIPFQEEPLEKTIERLQLKTNVKTEEKQFKEYVIRTGQYGPYIMKTSLKKPQFVSLPKGISPDTLTEKEVDALYKMGIEDKKTRSKK